MSHVRLKQFANDAALLMPLSVQQYHRMIRAKILPEGEPYELLDGLLVQKRRNARGQRPLAVSHGHTWVINMLSRVAQKFERLDSHIQLQQPVTIPDYDEPEPDAAIIRGTIEDYRGRHPGPSDVLCVIEVDDASLRRDRTIKQRIYADASLPLYLIMNLPDRCVEVYSEPIAGKGKYADKAVLKLKEKLSLPTGTSRRLSVPNKQLLP